MEGKARLMHTVECLGASAAREGCEAASCGCVTVAAADGWTCEDVVSTDLNQWADALDVSETVLSTQDVDGVQIETVQARIPATDIAAGSVRLRWNRRQPNRRARPDDANRVQNVRSFGECSARR